MSVSLDFADFFLGTLKDPKGSHKKKSDRERHFQGTLVPPNIALFWIFGFFFGGGVIRSYTRKVGM